MKHNETFQRILSETPKEISEEVRLSFAIADRIYSVLKERGLSQKEFARMMNTTDSVVSLWLTGTHNFTIRTIAKISAVLNTQIIVIGD